MKGKGSLALMEQLVMLLVFALAAALCLQAFVKSDQMSKDSEAADHAMVLCQSVAETVKNKGGDLAAAAESMNIPYGSYAGEGMAFEQHYNEDWTVSNTREYAYVLRAEETDSEINGLGKARVWVEATPASTLFELEFSWQEVTAHG